MGVYWFYSIVVLAGLLGEQDTGVQAGHGGVVQGHRHPGGREDFDKSVLMKMQVPREKI